MFQRILNKSRAFAFEVERVPLCVHDSFNYPKQMIILISKDVLTRNFFRFSMQLKVLLRIKSEGLVHPFDIGSPCHASVIIWTLSHIGRVKNHFRLFRNAGWSLPGRELAWMSLHRLSSAKWEIKVIFEVRDLSEVGQQLFLPCFWNLLDNL